MILCGVRRAATGLTSGRNGLPGTTEKDRICRGGWRQSDTRAACSGGVEQAVGLAAGQNLLCCFEPIDDGLQLPQMLYFGIARVIERLLGMLVGPGQVVRHIGGKGAGGEGRQDV
jgi:hypothetical protein